MGQELNAAIAKVKAGSASNKSEAGVPVFVMCRRGIDSVTATSLLRAASATSATSSAATPAFSATLNSVITANASPAAAASTAAANPPVLLGASTVQNIHGGLVSWKNNVDPNFPIY